MTSQLKDNHILVAGFAQLPKGTPVFEMQKSIGCILIVDSKTSKILDATFTFIQKMTNEFASSLLIGKYLHDIDEIVEEFEHRFIVPPQKAVIQSIIMAKRNFDEKFIKINRKPVEK